MTPMTRMIDTMNLDTSVGPASLMLPSKMLRRLLAADGYLDLEMPVQALRELEAIENPGPLEPAVQFLTGEALKSQERYDEAIAPLRKAAELIPAPYNRSAWRSLGECFRHRGEDELAKVCDMFAEE